MIRLLPLFLLCGAVLAVSGARLASFQVEEEDGAVLVSWKAEVEPDVQVYEVLRSDDASRNTFVRVGTVPAHGAGKDYLFQDSQVYKSEGQLVSYRLDVIYKDGLRETLSTQSLNYTSTAVRRTWGSIKAMFQ